MSRKKVIEPRKGWEKPEKVSVQLVVTMHFKKMVQKVNLGTPQAEKMKISQTILLKKSDISKWKKTGKREPRPVQIDCSFVVPQDEIAKRWRKYDRLKKRNLEG